MNTTSWEEKELKSFNWLIDCNSPSEKGSGIIIIINLGRLEKEIADDLKKMLKMI